MLCSFNLGCDSPWKIPDIHSDQCIAIIPPMRVVRGDGLGISLGGKRGRMSMKSVSPPTWPNVGHPRTLHRFASQGRDSGEGPTLLVLRGDF